jgi:hypothetical protein
LIGNNTGRHCENQSMRQRHRIQPYLSHELYQHLRRYCGKAVCTETAVVEAALKEYFARDTKDGARIIRRLDRMLRASGRQQRDLDVLGQMFALFVQLWLAQTPRVAESQKKAAEQSSYERYKLFVERVRGVLETGDAWSHTFPSSEGGPDKGDIDGVMGESGGEGP